MTAKIIVGLIVAGILALVGVALYQDHQDHERWVAACKAAGGHPASHSEYRGKTRATSYLCLSDDGRVLSLR